MLLALSTLNLQPATALTQGTAFTYQGRLNNNGAPANGSYDFRFRLASDPYGNNYVGGPVLTNGVAVNNGLLVATLDFGSVFAGANYWLEVDVRTNGAGGYTALSPLQPLTPAPYALMANTASNVSGTISAAQVSGASPATTGYQSFLCSDGKYRRLSIVQQGGIWTLGVEQAGTVSP